MKDDKNKPRKGTSGTGPVGGGCLWCFLGLCSCEDKKRQRDPLGLPG